MIPPDVANSLRLILPDQHALASNPQNQPVVPAQRLADVLSNLVPGQRILAEIQALLPNGNYRAVVAQRELTLALPFSAKAGDSLELEVVESDGKVALAVVANRSSSAAAAAPQASVSTNLSQTGKLIGNLLAGLDDQGKRAAPAPLNGNQPLVESFPAKAADLAPVLKDALVKSGVFYEAHQARWVAGQMPTAQLLLEPQGQHSPPLLPASLAPQTQLSQAGTPALPLAASPIPSAASQPTLPASPLMTTPPPNQEALLYELPKIVATIGMPPEPTQHTAQEQPAQAPSLPGQAPPPPPDANPPARLADSVAQPAPGSATWANSPTEPPKSNVAAAPSGSIPADLTPIVRQQLDALATQTFAWQGQVWPGQQMFWEIDEQQGDRPHTQDEAAGQWQTRLNLTLPNLGGVAATLRLRPGKEVEISLVTNNASSEAALNLASLQLRQQFEAAGLNLSQFKVKHGEAAE